MPLIGLLAVALLTSQCWWGALGQEQEAQEYIVVAVGICYVFNVNGENPVPANVSGIGSLLGRAFSEIHKVVSGKGVKSYPDGIDNNTLSIIVRSTEPTIHFQCHYSFFSPLTVSALGTKYIVTTCYTDDSDYSYMLIIATHSKETNIQITFHLQGVITYENNIYSDGDTLSVFLKEYQSFKISCDVDLTGTVVTSEQTVAVFSIIVYGVNVVAYDQLTPVQSYGQEYVVSVFNDNNYRLEILGEHSETEIVFNDGSTVSVNSNGIYQQTLRQNTNHHFTSNRPVMATLCWIKSRHTTFSVVPPVERSLTNYFTFLNLENPSRFMIVSKEDSTISLTNVPNSSDSFTSENISGSDYKVWRYSIRNYHAGIIGIHSTGPITVTSYWSGLYRVGCSSLSTVTNPCEIYKPYPRGNERRPGNPYDAADPISDQYLTLAWYGEHGLDIARSMPSMNMCGTVYPIWLEELTDTEARMHMVGSANKFTVSYKKCGSFNVYELVRTYQSKSAYCVESQDPLVVPPIYTHKPEVEPIVARDGNRNLLEFHCRFLDIAQAEFYSVTWYVNGEFYKKQVPIRFNQVTAITQQEDRLKKPGFDLKCGVQARSFLDGAESDEQISDDRFVGIKVMKEQISDDRFVGIKILDPVITIMEGECKQVMVKMTAPFGCMATGSECELDTELFDINLPTSMCNGRAVARTYCGTDKINSSKWDTPVTMEVCGQIGIKYGSHESTQTLRLKTSMLFNAHDFWANYDIGEITVKVRRESRTIEGKRCSSVNDPHMTTFQGRLYEHHLDGVFTLYKHSELPIEVQLETAKCDYGFSYARCGCGLAIRAGQNVYAINRCGMNTWETDYIQREEGEIALNITRKGNGYRILLPTGGLIEAQKYRNWLNVYINPSVKDEGKVAGLCGQLTDDCSSELILRDGQVTTDPNGGICHRGIKYKNSYQRFSESWRVPTEENLFKGNMALQPWPAPEVYCACPVDEGKDGPRFFSKVECSADKMAEECITPPGFKLVASPVRLAIGKRRKRDIDSYDDSRYKRQTTDETTDTWKNGWTEEKAKTRCGELFNASRSISLCRGVPNVDPAPSLDNCVLDIKLVGNEDFMMSAIDDVRSKCVREVVMEPKLNTSTDPDKPSLFTMVMDEVICPNECNNQGRCVEGNCVCNGSMAGEDCSVDLSIRPSIIELNPQDGCSPGHCEVVTVVGETFFESERLKCRITHLQVFEDSSVKEGKPVEVTAEFVNVNQINCYLPNTNNLESDPEPHVNGFRLAVTIGVNYSQEVDLIVLDPVCQRSKGGLDWQTQGTYNCLHKGRCISTDREKHVCLGSGAYSGMKSSSLYCIITTCSLIYITMK